MTLHKSSVDWVKTHLREELPLLPKAALREHAESLVAIAEQGEIAIELLIDWIHASGKGKSYAAAAWQRWCDQFQSEREQQRSQVLRGEVNGKP